MFTPLPTSLGRDATIGSCEWDATISCRRVLPEGGEDTLGALRSSERKPLFWLGEFESREGERILGGFSGVDAGYTGLSEAVFPLTNPEPPADGGAFIGVV
jgi:hypothetical protein